MKPKYLAQMKQTSPARSLIKKLRLRQLITGILWV